MSCIQPKNQKKKKKKKLKVEDTKEFSTQNSTAGHNFCTQQWQLQHPNHEYYSLQDKILGGKKGS
jgi:hypothetical protein